MDIIITPSNLQGSITLPTSKSALHRAIICASLASKTSTIKGVNFNDDTLLTLKALQEWGINYTYLNNTLEITGNPKPQKSNITVNCKDSGSTLRFLIPLFSQINRVKYIGSKYLFSRPLDFYQELYSKNNLEFLLSEDHLITSGALPSGTYIIRNINSSQFISGLLFYLPLLSNESTIITQNIVSKPYIDLTLEYLAKSGIVVNTNNNIINIPPNQKYQAFKTQVEGDLSQLGYFLTLGALGGPILINNININSSQGDKRIIDLFISMKASLEIRKDAIFITKSNLQGFTYDLKDTPDLGLLLMALASIIDDESIIYNLKGLSYKESNRLEVGLKLIEALGATYSYLIEEDKIIIRGTNNINNISKFDSFNDHRVIFTLVSISPILKRPLKITNALAVSKSYPQFWNDFVSLGGIIKSEKN